MEHCGSEGAMDYTIGDVTSDGSSNSSALIPSFISLTSSLHLSHILITSSISSPRISSSISSHPFFYLITSYTFIYLFPSSISSPHLSHVLSPCIPTFTSSPRITSSISSFHHFIYLIISSLHLSHYLSSK